MDLLELKIENVTLPDAIRFNFEELKRGIVSRMEPYQGLVYTDDQMGDAKKERANLNKLVKVLSDERIHIKKELLKPYEDFEAKINELTQIIQESVNLIDKQIKEHEQKKQQEKLNKIREYFAGHPSNNEMGWLGFGQIFNEKWLNASVSMKAVQEEITSRFEQIKGDLSTLSSLPEFGFEATEVYKTTLDINRALNEGRRLSEIQKRKVEHKAEQARLREETEARKQEKAVREAEQQLPSTPVESQTIEVAHHKQWISFRALLSTEDAKALKAFFESRDIEFKAI